MSFNNTLSWEVPPYDIHEFFAKRTEYVVIIPTWNEGDRIRMELQRMKSAGVPKIADIFLLDGGTTDGSIDVSFLNKIEVRGVLTIHAKGQGAAYRSGFAKVLLDGYKGVITVDGNNKDSVEQIPEFLQSLQEGWDFIQGSRFAKGGFHENTPVARLLAIKCFSNPLLSLVSGFSYTETMSAFRGFNSAIFADERLQIFRNIFSTWELQWYMASRIPRLGYKVKEIPQRRIYPSSGPVPTKINWRGNFVIIGQLLKVALGVYNPK